jgi:hypothetical protein
MERFDRGYVVRAMADNFGNGLSNYFPLYLKAGTTPATLFTKLGFQSTVTPNLSKLLGAYLESLKADPPDFFLHCVAVLHAPSYRRENAGALRIDWPRIPLPPSKHTLIRSAELGRALADLLEADKSVGGVTVGKVRPELGIVAAISREGGGSLNPEAGDLDVTVGWGHRGNGGAVMPGKGKIVSRDYTAKEREAVAAGAAMLGLSEKQALKLIGERTLDVYLNNLAYWNNIPLRIWEYTIGGYQVIKKWLSYREREILERALKMDEARVVTEIARRIAAILLIEPQLDANYDAVKKSTDSWRTSTDHSNSTVGLRVVRS